MNTLKYTFESKMARDEKNKFFVGEIQYEDWQSHMEILDIIFTKCNRGSGREDAEFLKSSVPSMSTGDRVRFLTREWECANFGWREVKRTLV